jgi:NAD(P)H-dependent FMN reductase
MANTVQIMGLGGSLRAASTSRTALEVALQATTAAGAHARLVWVRDLDLPLYSDGHVGAEAGDRDPAAGQYATGGGGGNAGCRRHGGLPVAGAARAGIG